jgi:hypothetical protein
LNIIPNQAAATTVTVYCQVNFREPLLCAPFIYNDSAEFKNIGLTGVKNIKINLNFNSAAGAIRFIPAGMPSGATTIGGNNGAYANGLKITCGWNQSKQFDNNCYLNYILIDAPKSFSLPKTLKNRIPITTFERTPKTFSAAALASGAGPVSFKSDSITLTRCPFYIIAYCRPTTYGSIQNGAAAIAIRGMVSDFYLQINRVNVTWNNSPSKASTYTNLQLYEIAKSHGLQDSFLTWSGQSYNRSAAAGGGGAVSQVPTVGGFIILQPGIDFEIPADEVAGCVTNHTFQVELQCTNQTSFDIPSVDLCVVAVFEDFLENDMVLLKSNVITGIVGAESILKADRMKPASSELELTGRYLGGAIGKMHHMHRRSHKIRKMMRGMGMTSHPAPHMTHSHAHRRASRRV